MKIRPKIPIYLGGSNIWYLGLLDYDPNKYKYSYDTTRLVNGDMSDTNLTPWKSNISGYDIGRYLPTTGYGAFGINKAHYNYTKGVEGQDYYSNFGKDLLDENGNFTATGEAWAKAVDALLPENSNATFYDPVTKLLRTSWTTQYKDAHGRGALTFNNLRDYVNHVRNDLVLGARHNVFLNKGKRYFYIDNEGQKHWVNPDDIDKYNVSENPAEQDWEGTTYWDDYELTGLKDPNQVNPTKPLDPAKKEDLSITEGQKQDPESPWANFGNKLKAAAPDILDALRLAGNLHNNSRVFDHMMKAIRPSLQLTYLTHRLVVGDEATKLAYYRRAAQGQTQAAKPFTSDADRQMAYMMEAKRVGDELRAQGDLADNQMIRQTSDESNQHEWGNTQRRTEVANYNINQLNQAYAAKEQLKAQKHSADWTNVDNYLMGIQNKWELKRAKQEAILDLLNALLMLDDLANNPQIKEAETQLNDLAKKLYPDGNINWNDTRLSDAIKNLQSVRRKEYIKLYRLLYGKRGAKVEYTADDKYLYKTSRDIVEHFRKMSKLADDSRIKTRPKPIKLSPHPNGNKRRKYQLGGVAPFTIYRPLGIGGLQTISASSDTGSSKFSSSKDTAAKDKLDMIKELFKSVRGLPVDVNAVYSDLSNLFAKYKAFGEEMSTDDIASIYLSSMLKINNLKYSQDVYEKAKALATSKESLEEFAVDSLGRFVVQDKDGNISYVKGWKEALESGKNPLTNLQLLDLRAYNPDLMSRKGDYIIENVVNNGMGINKIAAQIKALAGSLSSTEEKIDGISQVESSKVKAGLKILAGAPDGYYKHTINDKNQLAQVNAALNYITNMLSLSQKATLEAHGGVKENIAAFLSSQTGSTHEVNISPLTGKASDKGLGSGEKGDISSNPLLAMLREIGGMYLNYSLVTKDSNTKLSVNGTFYSLLPKISEDMSIDKMLSVSGIGGIIQGKRGITFGNLEIKPEDLKHIMYSNNGGMVVTLPCKIVNGIKLVNLDVVETYEKAEQKALQVNSDRNSSQFIQTLALELKNEHLDSLLDSNGLPNKNMFGQFLVVDAYTSDKIKFDINSKYVEKIENPDEELELRMSKALSTDNKKSDYTLDVKDHWTMFEGTWDDIYKGTVFIPLNNNPNAALNTWGNSAKIGQTTELEELYLISNKSSKFNGNNTLE